MNCLLVFIRNRRVLTSASSINFELHAAFKTVMHFWNFNDLCNAVANPIN